MTMYIC